MSDPWDGILEEGEEILWHGRPDRVFALGSADIIPLLFGLVFSAFALIWIAIVRTADAYFWVIGLLHFGTGVALTVYALARDTVSRRFSYYSLTTQRAIIGLSYPWGPRRLRKIRIRKSTRIRTDHEHTVTFGPPGRSKSHPFPTRAPQFARIDDADKVYHLMLEIQKGML